MLCAVGAEQVRRVRTRQGAWRGREEGAELTHGEVTQRRPCRERASPTVRGVRA